ncbi:hypothetical protein OO006_09380 [Prosthecochloris sp. SCSIO W1101]|uniref:hypothetical protein n=1 Tax=Prosthecochloris sp. SCSIO W1101 TaxID=2992242 RepID=UPI00223CFBBC|nr:hypothetical protein [Prosthecochloris sp. SCSIO W1101]UZJ40568.1 hypothetical protein OO006_09380 [Prosthecochloris sp. SCSIO W1101]
MDWHAILRFIHVTSFATWFGTVFASLFFLKTLEPKLTGPDNDPGDYPMLLQTYIKLETKVADAGFKTAIVSGLLLAFFFHGWTVGIMIKVGIIVLQVALTMGYIIKAIQPLQYPCSRSDYKKWYNLFTISLTMFALVLSITFFLL